jgi:hypothetical protein
VRVLKIADRFTGFLEEQMFVIDLAGIHEALAQSELPIQDLQRSRTEFDSTVFTGLGGVLVDAADARFADRQWATPVICEAVVRKLPWLVSGSPTAPPCSDTAISV